MHQYYSVASAALSLTDPETVKISSHMVIWPCCKWDRQHGMACPRVADGGTASNGGGKLHIY
jgi:hypothetical protein